MSEGTSVTLMLSPSLDVILPGTLVTGGKLSSLALQGIARIFTKTKQLILFSGPK